MHRFALLTVLILLPVMPGCEKPESASAARSTAPSDRQGGQNHHEAAKIDPVQRLKSSTQIKTITTTDKTMHILVAPKLDARILSATLGEKHERQFGVYHLSANTSAALGGVDGVSIHPASVFSASNEDDWQLTSDSEFSLGFRKSMKLKNSNNHVLHASIIRTVRVMSGYEIRKTLKQRITDAQLELLGYESINRLKNTHLEDSWTEGTPLPGLKSTGTFNVNANVTLIIPHTGEVQASAKSIFHADSQFTDSQPDIHSHPDQPLLFIPLKSSSNQTISIPYEYATDYVGFYDHTENILSFVFFNLPKRTTDPQYPSSNDKMYGTNGYPIQLTFNNQQLTVNTFAPTKVLKAGHSIRHRHRTIHVKGSDETLDRITQSLLGIPLKEIKRESSLAVR